MIPSHLAVLARLASEMKCMVFQVASSPLRMLRNSVFPSILWSLPGILLLFLGAIPAPFVSLRLFFLPSGVIPGLAAVRHGKYG